MTELVQPDQAIDPAAPETRIVILEDDDAFVGDVKSIARRLYGENISWERMTSVEEGLTRLDARFGNLPDIAIVDVGLEDGNGLDFVKAARERKFVFPIILISENELEEIRYHGQSVSRAELSRLGVTDFQSKTFISQAKGLQEFIKFVLSVSIEFERLLRLVDRPDRSFHSAICRDNIADISTALSLIRASAMRPGFGSVMTSGDVKDSVVLYLEGVIKKEQLQLEYTLRFSPREKIEAISIVDHEEAVSPPAERPSHLSLFMQNFSRIFFPSAFRAEPL